MHFKRPVCVLTLLLALLPPAPAFAQSTNTVEGLSLSQALTQLTALGGIAAPGAAIAVATALEVSTSPLGSSAAGFVFKLDPATGLRVRTATTFGPSFAERVLTAGEGKLSVSANLTVATYDLLGDFKLNRMELVRVDQKDPALNTTSYSSLVLSSQTLVLFGAIGATDALDLSVAVPLVKVKLEGLSWVERRNDPSQVLARAEASGVASGIGDIAVQAKYRLLKFGEGEPDPGGVAVLGTMRLPTGDADNLRGLGITRTMGSLVVSSGRGRFRPHGNVGFEFWSKGVDVGMDASGHMATAKNQIQYAAGLELEAAPKVTLIVDVLGRHVLSGGRIAVQSFPPSSFADFPEVTAVDAQVAVPEGLRKITLAPGLKWNVKGNVLLSLNALIPVWDNGLHDRFTPVLGLDWTF